VEDFKLQMDPSLNLRTRNGSMKKKNKNSKKRSKNSILPRINQTNSPLQHKKKFDRN